MRESHPGRALQDGGGAIDYDEFVEFYTAQNKGKAESAGRRMGKELLANLHAMMFNEAINEQKGKNEKHMKQEAQRFEAAVTLAIGETVSFC